MERFEVAVVGGGQAGLALSHELTGAGVEHVVLERGKVGETWRARWDTFCLVTPNWTVQLPGGHYDGDDPDGYLPRDGVVAFLERYATGFGAPVRERVDVVGLEPDRGGGFTLRTSDGELCANSVVLATGAYQRQHRPGAKTLPPYLLQIDIDGYRNPEALPTGRVLVVGSGQSGCQIAEELHEAGRDVVLACGRAPWASRRLGGRDIVWWGAETGFLDQLVTGLADPAARFAANIQATGHGGGRDLHYRTLLAKGVTLAGHFLGAAGHRAKFALDLAESVAWGDERRAQLMDMVRGLVAKRGLPSVDIPEPGPIDPTTPEELDLRDFGVVIFAGGFRPDYRSWLPWPAAFDDMGFPLHRDGASTVVPGLHFVGVHFLRKRKSSLLFGVGEDAGIVARGIAGRLGARAG
jgi:putative flavoprotein involved in K+ transport